ncbi:Agamous-like MADS-box protein AGL61 [Euphorbia peplus]|nr:Agamous-like MADS-box protein AGL61 [Euphorbia peplus]
MAGEGTKKTRGRQKIEMKKIENQDDKLITFSKRRSGVYKKASELVTLTNCQIGFVVYSPAGRPFTFAHPSVEAIVNRFLGRQGEPNDEANQSIGIEELTKQHNMLLQQLDAEKDKANTLKQKMVGVEKGWWDTPVEEQNLQQLQEMEANLRNIQMELIKNLHARTSDGFHASSSSFVQPQTSTHPRVEVQGHSQPFDNPPYVFNPFSFDHNFGEISGGVDDASSSFAQDQVQVQP